MAYVIAPDTFAGWEVYPANLPADDTIGLDALDYSKRLTERSTTLFSDVINVHIADCNDDPDSVTPVPQLIQDAARLEEVLSQSPRPQMRMISLNQVHSLSPFQISEELMRKTLTCYAVPPYFLDVLFGVSGNTKFSEEGYGAAVFSTSAGHDGSCEISYQFKFVERNDNMRGSPWSIRQMEVFNRVQQSIPAAKTPEENFWLLLTPVEHSKAKKAVEEAIGLEKPPRTASRAMRPHLQLISAYVDNWREYLDYEGQIYQDQRKLMLTTDFDDDVDFNASMNFEAMLTLRSLQDRLLSVPVLLEATMSTIDSLEKMNQYLHSKNIVDNREHELVQNSLRGVRTRLQAHAASANMLQKRVQGVENLLADGLSMRNQVIAATNQKVAAQNQQIATDISQTLLDLTLESVDDSAYVQLVSLATLIYLPGSFIASLFGTNFFAFGATARLRLASNVWIYVVVTIPLTIVTIACWWLAYSASRKERRNRTAREKKSA